MFGHELRAIIRNGATSMKLQFKVQQYQTDAVDARINVGPIFHEVFPFFDVKII